MAATAEAADEECEAAQAAAAAADDDWLYSSDDEDESVRRRDTLEALHRMDFSMTSAVRECESTQDEGQLKTGDSSCEQGAGGADSSRQGTTRGVAAATADVVAADVDQAATTDKPAADQAAATAADKPAAHTTNLPQLKI